MPERSPSRITFPTAIALVATTSLLLLVVLLHPAPQLDAVRRTLGLGSERALPAVPVEDLGGVFAFTMTQRGSDDPVGWDPCEPIPYRVNPTDAPVGGDALIERAVARVSAATGLELELEGSSDQRPFTERFVPVGTDRPVVIGWGTAAEFPELGGDIAGLGGGAAEQGVLGRAYVVTGGVVLDTDVFTDAAVANTPQIMEAIVLHELAHVVGLDHVDEPLELMAAANTGQIDLGPGDREGLARLGALPCA